MSQSNAGGIARNFISFISLLVFGIILLFIIFFYQESKSMITREFEIRGVSLSKRFAADCRLGVMLKNQSMLLTPMARFTEEEDVSETALFDSEGSLIKRQSKVGRRADHADTRLTLGDKLMARLLSSDQVIMVPAGAVYDFYIPVRMQATGGDLLIADEGAVVGFAQLRLSSDRIDRAMQRTITTSLIFGVVILISGIVLSVVLARKISSPIIIISERMEEIGTGEADLTQRLVVRRGDELGRLAAGFNNFVKTLSGIIREILAASPRLSEQSWELVHTSKGLTEKAESNIDQVQLIAEGLGVQLQKINGVVREAKETQVLAKETVESAERSKKSSDRILVLSTEGKAESQTAIENIGHLVEEIQKLTQRITTLGSETARISNISETINTISKQTNLLALNASIEAARAGQAGSGFRIIALEVSKLAEMSRFQAEEIGKIISNIVQKISIMVSDVAAAQEGVVQSKEILLGAAQRLKYISEEMTGAVTDIEAIARKGEINQKSVDRLVMVLDQMAGETKNSASSAQSVSASIQEQRSEYSRLVRSTQVLETLSENLKNLVTHFKI